MQRMPDISTVELSRTRLKLRDDLLFVPQQYNGTAYYHIEVKTSSAYFRIGYPEYVFVSLLDGRTSFSEALAIASQNLRDNALSQNQAMEVYSWLLDSELGSFADEATAASGASGNVRTVARPVALWKKLNPLWLKIPLGRPEGLLRTLYPGFGWMFSAQAALPAIVLMIVAVLMLASHWTQFTAASATVFSRDNWLWLLGAWVALKVIHELGHGLVCLRYGGSIRETGLIFAVFAPLAYVDASASWAFRSRWQRIHTAIAGVYVELVIAAVSAVAWTQCDSAIVRHLLQNVIIMASVSTLLFNLNPLMRFDGYYVLSDLLQIPNLSSQSNAALQSLMHRILLGGSAGRPSAIGMQRWILLTYGASAFCWRFLIVLTLLIAASVLFHGAGIVLAAVGVVLWFGRPIWGMCVGVIRLRQQHPERLLRASMISLVFIAVLTLGLMGLPAPLMSTAPGIVDFTDGQIVRAVTAGFVDAVHVENGQEVVAGDVLISLRNDEVTNRFVDLRQQVDQEELRLKTASSGHDSGAISIAQGNLTSLTKQLAECQKQLNGLQLRASRAGRVIGRDLKSLHATYAEAGVELLTIGLENEKEVRLSIDQKNLPASIALVGQSLRIRVGTHPAMNGTLLQVNPRANRSIPHPALAAVNGGPLPVVEPDAEEKSSSGERLRLTEHRFTAIVQLPPDDAAILNCGERGVASLGLYRGSVGTYLWRSVHDWISAQFARLKTDG